MNRRRLGFAGLATCLVLVVACSDDEETTQAPTTTIATGGSGGAADGGAGPEGGGGGSGGSGGTLACSPVPIDGFSPTWTPPTEPMYAGACTDEQIDDGIDACFGSGATEESCNAAKTANADCWACLLSDPDDEAWGAIVDYTESWGYYDRNLAGCIAYAEGDYSAEGCGAAMTAYWECVAFSCAGCLPASTTAAIADYNDCSESAVATSAPCESYYDALSSCYADIESSTLDLCAWGSGESWATMAKRYGRLFCGTEPTGEGGAGGTGGGGGGGGSGGAGGNGGAGGS